MTCDVDKIFLLSFQLDRLLHSLLLEIFGPFLLADICNIAKNTFQAAVGMIEVSLVEFLRTCAEQDPGVAGVAVTILPLRLEAEFCRNWFGVDSNLFPKSTNNRLIHFFDRVDPVISADRVLRHSRDLVPGVIAICDVTFSVSNKETGRTEFGHAREARLNIPCFLRPCGKLLRQLNAIKRREFGCSLSSSDFFLEEYDRRKRSGKLPTQKLDEQAVIVIIRSPRVYAENQKTEDGFAGGGMYGTDDDIPAWITETAPFYAI